MEKKQPKWKPIRKGEKLPCWAFLRKMDGTILNVTGQGVTIAQDAYYLPAEDLLGELEHYPIEESEDERIKKAIKYGLYYVFTNNTTVYETTKEQCLAWLEKQGEHANFRNKIQIGDKVTRNEDGVLVNLSQLNRVAKKDEKKGEQNINNSIWHKVEPKEYVLEKTLIYKKNGEIDIVEDTILSAVDAEYALPISYLGKPESIEKQAEKDFALTEEDMKLIWNIGDEIPYMPEEDFFKELLKRFKAQKGKMKLI